MAKKKVDTLYSLEEYTLIAGLSRSLVSSFKVWGDLAPKTLLEWENEFQKFKSRKIK